ncbi:Aspartate aminotransferase, partial [Actinidia chinensis var. chinensis]
GAYRDDEGRPVALQCVRDTETKIAGSQFLESLPSAVNTKLVEESAQLAYGKETDIVQERRFAGIQALLGTGACHLFAEFQRRFHPKSPIYLPVSTWCNHHNIWIDAQVPVRTFDYHPDSKGLYFTALMDDIKMSLVDTICYGSRKQLLLLLKEHSCLLTRFPVFDLNRGKHISAPDNSFFLLHPCAHNPAGVNPNEEQWREISHQLKVKNHFPFFDMAYQGLASGDIDRDVKTMKMFRENGCLIGRAQPFTKIMGLYGHRVGCLSILSADEKQAIAIRSQLQQIARVMYSSPPVHGSLLVSTILGDSQLKALWEEEVKAMGARLIRMRAKLCESLEKLDSTLNWECITNQ